MTYSYVLADSIARTNLEDWNALRDGDPGPFMDPRLMAAVEASMADEGTFWTLIIYDEQKRPAASACLALLRFDGMVLANRWAKRLVDAVRRVWRNYLYFHVLLVGLPISAGQSHLRIRPDADATQVLAALDAVLRQLAARHGAWLTALKEFDEGEAQRIDGLRELGYLRADSVPMHYFPPRFRDIDDYCSAVRSDYRTRMRSSMRKFEKAGLRTVSVTGREGAGELFTDDVHRLYEAVLARTHTETEHLPANFFRHLARLWGEQAVFTYYYRDERPVGFTCCLKTKAEFHMLYLGMDYDVSKTAEMYFNIFYRDLDYAMRQQVPAIYVGPNAEHVKLQLGCYQRPRYFFIKGRGLLQPLLRAFSSLIFPPVALQPPRDVFREPISPP